VFPDHLITCARSVRTCHSVSGKFVPDLAGGASPRDAHAESEKSHGADPSAPTSSLPSGAHEGPLSQDAIVHIYLSRGK
jgi:hypothetical protein